MAAQPLRFDRFGDTIEAIDATIAATRGLLALGIGCEWSPTSGDLLRALMEARDDGFATDVKVMLMEVDSSLAAAQYATRNGIPIGAGGIKLFENGRELVVRRKGQTCYTILGLLRPSQIKTILAAVLESSANSTIPSVDL